MLTRQAKRQRERQRERELQKLTLELFKITPSKMERERQLVFNLAKKGLDTTKSQERQNLEYKALSFLVARGNPQYAVIYIAAIEELPDIVLSLDYSAMFNYVNEKISQVREEVRALQKLGNNTNGKL